MSGEVYPAKEFGALGSARRLVSDFAAYAGPRGAWALVITALAALLEGFGLALIIPLLAVVTQMGSSAGGMRRQITDLIGRLGAHAPASQLAVLLGLFGVLMMLRAVAVSWRSILQTELQVGFVESRRARLARRLAAARWDQVVRLSHARVAHVLSGEVQKIGSAVSVTTQSLSSVLTLVVQCALAFALSPPMAAFALGLLAAGILAYVPVLRRARSVGAILAERHQALLAQATGFLGGLKLAVSQNLQAGFVREFDTTLDEVGRKQIDYARQQSISRVALTTVTALVGAALVMVGFGLFHMAAPVLITLLLIISRMSGPAGQIQQGVQQLAFALPSYDGLKALEQELEALPGDAAPPAAAEPFPEGQVVFAKVGFIHTETSDGPSRGVEAIELSIEPGEFLGISGASGAGKTTLADLLVGIYPPQSGDVRVGGRPLSGATLLAWRQGLSYISQDAFLFHDTLRRNLAWARPDASEDEMWEALRLAGADNLVRRMSDGLDAVAGERGTLVSGGERQRIALARALLRRPRLLVLDEATSAIDVVGEKAILERLSRLQPRPTIVMIAHRPQSLAFCDRVIELEGGRLKRSRPRSDRRDALEPEQGLA